MKENTKVSSVSEELRPGTVTAALWIGWSYQLLVLCICFFIILPQRSAYIEGLTHGSKPINQITRDDINMIGHPDATLFGEAIGHVLMFALSAWLLYKVGLARAWARNVLVCLFSLRLLASLVMFENVFVLFDVSVQLAVIVLLFLPASRHWFVPKAISPAASL
jgi:hypothetical protein